MPAVRDQTPVSVVCGPAASTGPVTMRAHGPAPINPIFRGALTTKPDATLHDHDRHEAASHEVTDGMERAPARAMLRAIGMTDDDWGKSQVGVVSSWNEVTPCNMPLDRLAKRSKVGVRDAGGFPIEFMTIVVSDGISMGTRACAARSCRADRSPTPSNASMTRAPRRDGDVRGLRQEPARHDDGAACSNLPSVFLYGGSILPGHYKDQALDVVSVFEAVGACRRPAHSRRTSSARSNGGRARPRARARHVHRQHDGGDQRGHWPVAPGLGVGTAVDRRRDDLAYESGRVVMNLLALDIGLARSSPRTCSKRIVITMALGGSTNVVLHLLAIVDEARVELELEDFNRIGARFRTSPT